MKLNICVNGKKEKGKRKKEKRKKKKRKKRKQKKKRKTLLLVFVFFRKEGRKQSPANSLCRSTSSVFSRYFPICCFSSFPFSFPFQRRRRRRRRRSEKGVHIYTEPRLINSQKVFSLEEPIFPRPKHSLTSCRWGP